MNPQYLNAMFRDNGQVEVRGLLLAPVDGSHIHSGLYSDRDALVRDVADADKSGAYRGIYALLNRPKHRQATNCLTPATVTTKDDDIERVTRIAFDFDPVRDESNSDAEELEAARLQAAGLCKFLASRGWPEPLKAMSGNGYHLQYRVGIQADQEMKDLIDVIYKGLKARFDTPEVAFDGTIRNPSRIFRLYGTTARKGDATPDRPQRMTRCWVPAIWDLTGLDLLEELAAEVKPMAREVVARTGGVKAAMGSGDYRTLDVVSWFQSNGHYLRDMGDGKHAVICPWANEHSGDGVISGTVVWEAKDSGWPTFRCLHAHCADRRIGDVMAFFGGADSFCRSNYGQDGRQALGGATG